jgi:hypothetical protein
MKNVFIGAAGTILFCAHAAAEEGSVQIYGRLNLALERVEQRGAGTNGRKSELRESNPRSVLGFRGSETLGGTLHLIFQVEGTLAPDTGTGAIAARDTRVGFEGSWGALFAGNWTSPYNSATSALDPFYPSTAGYMSIMGKRRGRQRYQRQRYHIVRPQAAKQPSLLDTCVARTIAASCAWLQRRVTTKRRETISVLWRHRPRARSAVCQPGTRAPPGLPCTRPHGLGKQTGSRLPVRIDQGRCHRGKTPLRNCRRRARTPCLLRVADTTTRAPRHPFWRRKSQCR